MRRARNSEAIKASIEIVTDIRVNRSASARDLTGAL
jgi:hypothetical protein